MISIIVCSKYAELNGAFVKNVARTIGTDFELVHIDNSKGDYSIFEAYNWGIDKSKGDILCFMHEDVIFHSHDWGKCVECHLAQKNVGLLGVAGGYVVPRQLDWRFTSYVVVNVIQGTYSTEENSHYHIVYRPPSKWHFGLRQVAIIDGVWMCMRKEIFQHIRFDEKNFHSFHLYDSDISMQVNAMGLGIYVALDVLLEHKSMGTFTPSFTEALKTFIQKWDNMLPLIRGINSEEVGNGEITLQIQDYYEKRMAYDAMTIQLREIFQKKKAGIPCRDYTEEELFFMDESAYRFRHDIIKDKKIPRAKVAPLVWEYMHSPYARRKWKLFYKYFWYRIIR